MALTGERTLPDVPAENYWFRRHLVVYRWIAGQLTGGRVLDMACGEGYGSAALLAGGAEEVVGVDANPEAHEHARLRYVAPGLRFERGLIDGWQDGGSFDVIAFLQTIEHVRDPGAVLRHLGGLLADGGTAFISTPNVLTLAPSGAQKSDNPWHVREYRAHEFRELLEAEFAQVRIYGLYHSGKLRWHELALKLGWDRVHRSLGITSAFYERFTPAISAEDFVLSDIRPLHTALDFVAVCRGPRVASTRERQEMAANT